VFQTKSGVGVYYRLERGEKMTIGRRYGFVVKTTPELKRKFSLPECPILFFVSDERTSTSSVQTKNIFVCVPSLEKGAKKLSTCRVVCFISLPSGTIVKNQEHVASKCLEHKKKERVHTPRKAKKEKAAPVVAPKQDEEELDFCPPPLSEEQNEMPEEREETLEEIQPPVEEEPAHFSDSSSSHHESDDFSAPSGHEDEPGAERPFLEQDYYEHDEMVDLSQPNEDDQINVNLMYNGLDEVGTDFRNDYAYDDAFPTSFVI